ncbi:multiple sugar transport system substrate-binding protein [Anaerotaenia torta]|uniref:extracellular solute-binding protein n=1 Tax=Anaerotaenia torta TaxID=433293 RepID=UPI003D24B3B5
MVTLKEVARRAGVSVATVSYCINGKKNISPETQLKIREAIAELNYIPNFSARSLKNRSSDEIGVVLPNLDDSTNSEILKGIIAQAGKANYSVNVACSYNNPRNEQEIIHKFIGKNYAGIILMTCQSHDSAFFKNTLFKNDISNVFIMRLPQKISGNFLGFDNYNTVRYLTESLLQKGYEDIAIVTGPEDFFSESECINGLMEAHDKYGKAYHSENILCTDMSKEGAFKVTMLYLSSFLPQAIITSSQTIMDGVIEACDVHNIKPKDNICLITLSEERWNQSGYNQNVLHTAATAYTLGEDSFRVLMEENIPPQLYDRKFKLYKDNVLNAPFSVPKPEFKPAAYAENPKTIHIASTDLPTIRAIQAVSRQFLAAYNIKLEIDFYPLRELFSLIEEDTQLDAPNYDIYLSDVSWMAYFTQKNVFMDITEVLNHIPELAASVFPKNLNNAKIGDRSYGFPVIGGTQFLFYRKDLFEDPQLQRQYKATHSISLRPPRTWTEFNRISRFFTREYNPASPTKYGTSISSNLPEDFMLELLIRLWSHDGGLFNSRNQMELNTPQNVNAFINMVETVNYTPPMINSSETTFEQIGSGQIAMAITFTEYASKIQNSLHPEFLSKIGYSRLPGNTPANVGWHFCVSKQTQKLPAVKQLFQWLCQRQNSYYQTILCGQSTLIHPHTHHELLLLYPWLELTAEGLAHCRNRVYPVQGKNGLIVPADFEANLRIAFHKMCSGELTIPKALEKCQTDIINQFFI